MDCWLWLGSHTYNGYGRVWGDGKMHRAHRYFYETLVGPIPSGLQLDHLCRARSCVNPTHLEPVTPTENTRRGEAGLATGARNKAKKHCPRGHRYTKNNTYLYPDRGRGVRRECRTCKRNQRG